MTGDAARQHAPEFLAMREALYPYPGLRDDLSDVSQDVEALAVIIQGCMAQLVYLCAMGAAEIIIPPLSRRES